MALNDIYVVSMESGVEGARMIQDFSYRCTFVSTVATAADLREVFVTTVVDKWADCVQEDTDATRFVVRNLFNAVDWEENVPGTPIAGQRTGQALPFFNAVAFRSKKPTPGQQPARKRFGYLSETDVQGGGVQDVLGYFTALNALATALGQNLVSSAGNGYSPVIVKRIKYTTPSGKAAYRYPESLGELTWYLAEDWDWTNLVTSQITRKVGRGI